jgi:endonuclease/exonuclease/phosphatase family metal-dependent hydrolase
VSGLKAVFALGAAQAQPERVRRWKAVLWPLCAAVALTACANSAGPGQPAVGAQPSAISYASPTAGAPTRTTLRVMTLNIAHARRTGFHQMFQTTGTALHNLDAIGRMLIEQAPDVVALQEADGGSFWNGNFNHVAYLAGRAALMHFTRAEHVRTPRLSYGTALLSAVGLASPLTVTFDSAVPALPKGFLVSTIRWPGHPDLAVDVVSLHLDPFNASARSSQARQLIDTLKRRGHALIVMGDFNSDWYAPTSAVRELAEALQLRAFEPERRDLATFPARAKRLDWILVSPHFEFVSHRVLADSVSDHQGVVAHLKLSQPELPRI